jgi:hypothetical protein
MARDSAARPHKLLNLEIKNIVFKISPDKKQYAQVLLNGKTGSRYVNMKSDCILMVFQSVQETDR